MTQAKTMSHDKVRVRELAAWGLDDYTFRPQVAACIAQPSTAPFKSPIVPSVPQVVTEQLKQHAQRADLHAEMKGLDWTTGIVDLHQLIAFQRRLVFDDNFPSPQVPSPGEWPALIDLAFGPPIPITYRTVASTGAEILLQSENPNLQFRPSTESDHLPFVLHGGSPFFEVGEFDGRWFLRDGYHRAYRLLLAGVAHVPAVIVRARTLAELGPVQPWFFSRDILFSSNPPRVTDFLDDAFTIEYDRPRLFKILRVTMEESVEPALFQDNSGESK